MGSTLLSKWYKPQTWNSLPPDENGIDMSDRASQIETEILKGVQAFVFDVGGTLYVSEEFDRQFNVQIEHVLCQTLNVSQDEARRRLRSRIEELSRTEGDPSKVRAMSTFRVSRDQVHEAFCKVDPADFLGPDERLRDVLTIVRDRTYRLAILSNFREALVKRTLEVLSLPRTLFEFCITEDDGLPIKPAKEPFLECVNRFALRAEEIAYVGDSLKKDMVPARGVGLRTIWVHSPPETGGTPEFVDLRIESVIELGEMFERPGTHNS